MARLHASVLVIDFSATARLVLSRRTGLSTGPNKIFCPAGIGSSACPHIIGTSLWFVGVSVGLVPRSDIFQSPDCQDLSYLAIDFHYLFDFKNESQCGGLYSPVET